MQHVAEFLTLASFIVVRFIQGNINIEIHKPNRRRWWTLGVLTLGAFMALWYWLSIKTDPVVLPDLETNQIVALKIPKTDLPETPSEQKQDIVEPTEIEALEQFKQNTRYPVSTRKINENSHDLLNPGSRHENRQKLLADKNNPNLDWQVHFTADRYFVTEKESLLVFLQLWNKGEPVLPEYVTMLAETVGPDQNTRPVKLVAGVDGNARAAVLIPNQYWPDYVGQARITAEFSAADLEKQTGTLDFFFTSAKRIPAIFTGKINDRLDNGDLLFDIEIDVKTAGLFRVDGNLFDSDGLPFGWARYEGNLPIGLAVISLRYYGLLFHDAEAVGQYMLKNLQGLRLRPGDSPFKEDMPGLASDYVTKRFYDLDQFRTDVNNSPRRQKMIEMYEDAIRRGVRLTNPAYTSDG